MIYNKFFGFREDPFGVTPDPRFLYMSKRHEDALAHLNFGISEGKGFVMLTGEVGSGKTTLIRYLLDNLPSTTHTSLIINPMVDPLELLKLINHDFGVVCTEDTQKDHLDALNNFLLECYSRNEKAVLLIDEAQELSIECLEFIRLLSNLETNTKKLLQVILVGQPELKIIVSSDPLRQLDQRIAVRYHLEPLDLNDTIIYINHRLKIAGGGMVTFPVRGAKLIHKYSAGIPRLINLACDRALLLSYSDGKKRLDINAIKNAVRDLGYHSYPDKKNIGKDDSLIKPIIAGIATFILVIIAVYSNIHYEENYLDKISSILKNIRTEGEFFIKDGIYMVSKGELSETACILNLLNIWGEQGLQGNTDINKDVEKRGYSIYKTGSDLDTAIRFDMPCILYMKQDKGGKGGFSKCAVLRWVVGNDAMLIDPHDGKNILPIKTFKNSVTGIALLYKDRYRTGDKITMLQKELKRLGLYDQPITGELGPKTKKALMQFQEKNGLEKTGVFDEETTIILSSSKDMPRLIPE
ncbi:MAG: AAA family ATPase [Nitrospirae bacterium]|nr:AAA family ATPase [Nitrospirota bacterium]